MTRGAREGSGSGSNRGPGGQRRAGAVIAVRGGSAGGSRSRLALAMAWRRECNPAAACGGDIGGVGAAGAVCGRPPWDFPPGMGVACGTRIGLGARRTGRERGRRVWDPGAVASMDALRPPWRLWVAARLDGRAMCLARGAAAGMPLLSVSIQIVM